MMEIFLGLIIGAAVLFLVGFIDMQFNKLPRQIRELKEDLTIHIDNKIEESERSILDVIEEDSLVSSEDY